MFVWIARSGTTQAVAPIPGALGQSYAVGAGNSGPANTRDAAALVFDVNIEPGAYDVLYLDSVPGDNRGVTTFDVYATRSTPPPSPPQPPPLPPPPPSPSPPPPSTPPGVR